MAAVQSNNSVFTLDSAKRIAKVTRAYEAEPVPSQARPNPAGGIGPEVIAITIDSNASGGGKYLAKLLKPLTADVAETCDLTAAEIGTAYTAPDPNKILALNGVEVGQSTHALDAGTVCMALIRRKQTNKIMVVLIVAIALEDCNPTDGTSSSEGG